MPNKIRFQTIQGVKEITCEDLHGYLKNITVIDVRGPDEFNDSLGHIEGAKLVSLGPEFTNFLKNTNLDNEIVFVCRSGGRSHRATSESIQLGFKSSYNLKGGMLRWNDLKLPVKNSL
jgi:hydroxyacylglutathione hydrolase